MIHPKISVVTSVYNCERFIAETIQSVINQTFEDWEFIIIDDCSSDNSSEIIRKFDDPRIRYIINSTNQGQVDNLNRGIELAKGEYIARLDHDDICYPERFEKQVEYMDMHPEVGVCGCLHDIWKDGVISKLEKPPIHSMAEFEFTLKMGRVLIAHSSYMIRKSVLTDNNIKYESFHYAEDYQLLMRVLLVSHIDCLYEALIAYRIFGEQCTQNTSGQLIRNEDEIIRKKYFDNVGKKDCELFIKAGNGELKSRKEFQEFVEAYESYAIECAIVKEKKLIKESDFLVWLFHWIMMRQGYSVNLCMSYVKTQMFKTQYMKVLKKIVFFIKCFIGNKLITKFCEEKE